MTLLYNPNKITLGKQHTNFIKNLVKKVKYCLYLSKLISIITI